MRAALRDVSRAAEEAVELKPGDTVLDIGANDGTYLESYSLAELRRIGCEPADNLIEGLTGRCDHVLHDFWNLEAYQALATREGFSKAKVITALGMFYDLEDPGRFIADAAGALDEDGVFIAQLMCLATMLEKNDLGNICHEHIEYYSLESLRHLFENNGLEMFRIEENDVNGGSYRIFARPYRGTGMDFDEHITSQDVADFVARRAQSGKMGEVHHRHRNSHRLGRRGPAGPAGLFPGPALGLFRRILRARKGLAGGRRQVHRPLVGIQGSGIENE